MTDNTRQEVVERAAVKVGYECGRSTPNEFDRALAARVLDASGLIEQLTEAIAQRDEARRGDWADRMVTELTEQLAAERALCDRLAEQLQYTLQAVPSGRKVLADYDAYRRALASLDRDDALRASEHREL